MDLRHGGGEDVLNPATRQAIGRVPHASPADLDRALEAARRGFAAWSAMSPVARQEVMERAARLIEERREEIARWCTMEMGKTLAESRAEMDFVGSFAGGGGELRFR